MQQEWFDLGEWGRYGPELQTMVEFTAAAGERLCNVPVAERRASLKEDGTPITAGDLETNLDFVDLINRRFPGDGVIGEEAGLESAGARAWVIDPIDGTWQYMLGLQTWTIAIACLEDGVPVAGLVCIPDARRPQWIMACASRPDVHRNGRAIAPPVERAGVVMGPVGDRPRDATVDEAIMTGGVLPDGSLRIGTALSPVPTIMRGALAISGTIDALIYNGTKTWDVAPLDVLARQRGMTVTDLDGAVQRYDGAINGAIIASDAELHAALVEEWRLKRTSSGVSRR